MSTIPTSAIPHAYSDEESHTSKRDQLGEFFVSAGRWARDQYDSASRALRNDPRIAAAAGATVFAAVAAVFAPRLWRQRSAIGL